MTSTAPKRVCIIGAGPSGLAAAKTLTHDYPGFHVTVLEKSHRIGGLWPVSKVDDGLVNPDMCTNQSRHTVSFSDLAWEESSPLFPKAWQVGKYLERYRDRYGLKIRTGCEVVSAVKNDETWQVGVREDGGKELQTESFDRLVVTSGFFGAPIIPPVLKDFSAPVWHSSRFRSLASLLTDNGKRAPAPGKKIVVVGGQMSGVEVAASVALQLSSTVNSPGKGDIEGAEKYEVVNVVQKPFWVMPFFFPKKAELEGSTAEDRKFDPAPTYLPLDLTAYNLAVRPPGPIVNNSGHIIAEAATITHNFMNSAIGTDQSELGAPELTMQGECRSQPPYLGISDNYNEFVRSGNIKVLKGKVTGPADNSTNSILIENDGEKQVIEDVAAVIFATGFEASPSLNFLPKEMLETLQFDSNADTFPLALNVNACASRLVPSLGFVGFYRSAYWGVIEMQSRYLGALWSGQKAAIQALEEDKTMETMLKLRGDPRRAQFPMGDYIYLMESFAEILGIKRKEDGEGRTGMMFPGRYSAANATPIQQKETSLGMELFHKEFERSENGKNLSRVAFRGLQGDWKLERDIESRIATYPSGTLRGTAKFLPRVPTAEGYDGEFLYLEEGSFESKMGQNFTARRSYVYRYTEKTDKLTAWFTKDDHKTVDYFFHEVKFLPKVQGEDGRGWLAKADHWCQPDQYDVEYEWRFRGVALESWTSGYVVKGPNKDYTIRSVFTR